MAHDHAVARPRDVVDRYVRKGTQLYIEGRLRTREWMDKDNNKRYTTEILADTMNRWAAAATTRFGRRRSGLRSAGAGVLLRPAGRGIPAGRLCAAAAAASRRGSPAAAPAAPSVPADDPDDLPF